MNRTALPTRTALPSFTLGQRVIVMAPDTWLHRREGIVVSLPRHSGLLHDPFVSVEIDGDTPLGPSPVRQMDPRRVAPVSTCETCVEGCDCDGAAGDTDCGHYACRGRADGQTKPRCPGADAERAQMNAYKVAGGWAA